MKTLATFLVTLLAAAAPLTASAESVEERYCEVLADKYADTARGNARTDDIDVATAKCDAGDTKDGVIGRRVCS